MERRGRVLQRWLCTLLASIGCAGCVHVAGTVPARRLAAGSGHFVAGAARIDITPIPGIPMAGHSVIGRVARGYWSRLHARAVYLEDAQGRGIALVQCDLWSIAGGLSDRVAQLLATRPELIARLGGRTLGREQIVLAATHTHHSPGLYSTDLFFATFSGRESGFDPELFGFLAQRIAWVVAEAVATAQPARVYERQAVVPDAFRNRSMPAFRANPEAASILAANAALPLCAPQPDYPDAEACRGVDARVITLRIEATRGGVIAALVVFAAHPTLVSHLSTLYSADLHGAVAVTLEERLRAQLSPPDGVDGGPPVAVFNGAEGDVSGTWTRQTRADVLRVSADIVSRVWPALADPAAAGWRRVDGDIAFQFERIDLRRQRVERPGAADARTASIPMPGRAVIEGAEDGRSHAWSLLFGEGTRGLDLGPHGSKLGAVDLLAAFGFVLPPFWPSRLVTLLLPPPSQVGLGVYALGPLRLVALPGEFTTVQGRRIAASVAPAGGDREDVIVLGLAHDYAYYFTTPEEYELQHYEGAATLYGRWAGALVQARAARLAARLQAGSSSETAFAFDYRTGVRRSIDTRRLSESPAQLDAGTAPVAGDAEAAHPRVCWRDAVPRLGGRATGDCASARGGWECATPRVAIEVETPAGWRPHLREGIPEDDSGLSLLTLVARAGGSRATATCWCSYWLVPQEADPPARFRFAVETLRGEVIHSPAIDGASGSLPAAPACTDDGAG